MISVVKPDKELKIMGTKEAAAKGKKEAQRILAEHSKTQANMKQEEVARGSSFSEVIGSSHEFAKMQRFSQTGY